MQSSDAFLEAISFVSDLTGVPQVDIMKKSRARNVVVSRHFLRYYLRRNCNMTLQKVGGLTNGHHASVIHSVKYVEDYSLFDKTYKLYKESIDAMVFTQKITPREKITKVLVSQRNNEFKCNAILEIVQGMING
tara:strand:+ start:7956 stop:8357 length:402 start_codon:yes stop_codon:yes gene_type:complete